MSAWQIIGIASAVIIVVALVGALMLAWLIIQLEEGAE